jgi:hypothetical protein
MESISYVGIDVHKDKTAKDKAVKTDKSDVQMLARTPNFHSYK